MDFYKRVRPPTILNNIDGILSSEQFDQLRAQITYYRFNASKIPINSKFMMAIRGDRTPVEDQLPAAMGHL